MSQKFVKFDPYPKERDVFDYLMNQFGFPENLFLNYRLWATDSQPTIFIANKNTTPDNTFNTITFGLPCMRRELPRGYPTHYFLQRFGKYAKKNIFTLTMEQVLKLVNGERIQNFGETSQGPKILCTKNFIVGRGWASKNGLFLDTLKIWKQNLL